MSNHLLRNVPDATWRALVAIAAEHGIYEHPRRDGLTVTHRDGAKQKRGSVRGLLLKLSAGELQLRERTRKQRKGEI